MKMILSILLLLGFTVSIVHPYLMNDYDQETVISFVAEIEGHSECGDICDLHFEFHIPFILDTSKVSISSKTFKVAAFFSSKHLHAIFTSFYLIKPPIV